MLEHSFTQNFNIFNRCIRNMIQAPWETTVYLKIKIILQAELEEDIFRIYDVDNNGTIEFKVIITEYGYAQ